MFSLKQCLLFLLIASKIESFIVKFNSQKEGSIRAAQILSSSLQGKEVDYFSPVFYDEAQKIMQQKKVRDLPIFPLNIVKCPNGVCPLHIFEMKYRQLMNNIAKDDNKFGVLMLNSETRQIAEIGTVYEVLERSLLPDGRQMVVGVGRERFKLLQVVREKPYMIGKVEYGIADKYPTEESEIQSLVENEQKVWELVQDIVRLSNKVYDKTKVTISEEVRKTSPLEGVAASERINARHSAFSFAITEMLEIPLLSKQLMLQTLDINERLVFQAELLEKAQKLLAAQASIKDAIG
mmetsp:Transcript_17078/g.25260  ORF Transcript_17078/g.25260 Transcript_17078/m.25260 type:complete len:293 (+) Transcript_17078:30-908(+)